MPDLNTVPSSPHLLARRPSAQQMPPPPGPVSMSSSPSLNFPPSIQMASHQDNSSVVPGPGPLRHPRPLTAAELHSELEKEQEAVVNRLTRELSALRAQQNASVMSNASSASAESSSLHFSAAVDPQGTGAGFSHPRSSVDRHHRTSSNASARSLSAQLGSVATVTSISSPAPVRAAPQVLGGGISLSRQNSAASRRSRTGSPSPATAYATHPAHNASHSAGPVAVAVAASSGHTPQMQTTPSHSYTHSHLSEYFSQRNAHHGHNQQQQQQQQQNSPAPDATQTSPSLLPATSRYEETVFYRSELDVVKRENEALKRRVRELERAVHERRRRESATSGRGRSGSTSTLASAGGTTAGGGGGASIAGQRERDGRTAAPTTTTTTTTTTGMPIAGTGAGAGVVATGPAPEPSTRPRVASLQSASGSIAVGVPEEEVKVGESAASAGLAGER